MGSLLVDNGVVGISWMTSDDHNIWVGNLSIGNKLLKDT